MIPAAYRALLRDPRTRRLLAGLGVSSLGDGLSTVTIAWLAVRVAPAGRLGLFVGLAVAAYTLPSVVGAVAFGGLLRHRPARVLVLVHGLLRTGRTPVIRHRFKWKRVSLAAALCYGSRGGGAQLAFTASQAPTTPTA